MNSKGGCTNDRDWWVSSDVLLMILMKEWFYCVRLSSKQKESQICIAQPTLQDPQKRL